jgi:DNA invertase Pin-like site-specific DNA recombinase
MSTKITPDHLCRAAVVYVRQSTMAQVTGNLESQRRQYDLAGAAEKAGFASVTVIDDDLGRSGSGSVQRPGFERRVAMVCSGDVGAVYCIEASRLARNGRDWHHLIDLCALAGAVVNIDPDGAYDPRLVNDSLLLGLKGTMSEYELSSLRQRGIAARDSKARRGEYRFMLPPGFCWSEAGKIEINPDEHVVAAIRLVFAKFAELGSARQVFLWLRSVDLNATSAAATTHMWARDCALLSVGFELIARLPGRYFRPSQIALWKRRSSLRIRSSVQERKLSLPLSGTLKERAMMHLSPRVDTNLWIPPSVTSPASLRRVGTRRWSAWRDLSVE